MPTLDHVTWTAITVSAAMLGLLLLAVGVVGWRRRDTMPDRLLTQPPLVDVDEPYHAPNLHVDTGRVLALQRSRRPSGEQRQVTVTDVFVAEVDELDEAEAEHEHRLSWWQRLRAQFARPERPSLPTEHLVFGGVLERRMREAVLADNGARVQLDERAEQIQAWRAGSTDVDIPASLAAVGAGLTDKECAAYVALAEPVPLPIRTPGATVPVLLNAAAFTTGDPLPLHEFETLAAGSIYTELDLTGGPDLTWTPWFADEPPADVTATAYGRAEVAQLLAVLAAGRGRHRDWAHEAVAA